MTYRTSFKKKTKGIKVNKDGQCPPRWRIKHNDDKYCVPSLTGIKETKIEKFQRTSFNISDADMRSHINCSGTDVPCWMPSVQNNTGRWACCPKTGAQQTDRAGR